MEWSDADLEELHYPYLESGARQQLEEWWDLHRRLEASSPGCGVTKEELTWAMGVAYSRAFRRGTLDREAYERRGRQRQGGRGFSVTSRQWCRSVITGKV